MNCFSHICEHFSSRLILHKHCFFFSYLTRLFTQQWSSYVFLTSLKTKFCSLVSRCHIHLLIAFHVTINNLIAVFRCWLLNTFLSLLFVKTWKKYSESVVSTLLLCIYSSAENIIVSWYLSPRAQFYSQMFHL